MGKWGFRREEAYRRASVSRRQMDESDADFDDYKNDGETGKPITAMKKAINQTSTQIDLHPCKGCRFFFRLMGRPDALPLCNHEDIRPPCSAQALPADGPDPRCGGYKMCASKSVERAEGC